MPRRRSAKPGGARAAHRGAPAAERGRQLALHPAAVRRPRRDARSRPASRPRLAPRCRKRPVMSSPTPMPPVNGSQPSRPPTRQAGLCPYHGQVGSESTRVVPNAGAFHRDEEGTEAYALDFEPHLYSLETTTNREALPVGCTRGARLPSEEEPTRAWSNARCAGAADFEARRRRRLACGRAARPATSLARRQRPAPVFLQRVPPTHPVPPHPPVYPRGASLRPRPLRRS